MAVSDPAVGTDEAGRSGGNLEISGQGLLLLLLPPPHLCRSQQPGWDWPQCTYTNTGANMIPQHSVSGEP